MLHTDRDNSKQIYEALCRVIPGGVNSPVRSFKEIGISPLVVARGNADTIWDEDGRSYIDLCGSWGALILGHAHTAVVEASTLQMRQGSTFGITTRIEQAVAEKIKRHLPSIDKLRFVSSGTEAAMTALRLARGYTQKPLIVKFTGHYHGHCDSLLVKAGSSAFHSSSAGVLPDTIRHTACLPFNDIEGCRAFLRKNADQLACVIVEPIAANMGLVLPDPAFLHMLRKETADSGALLIFDEVISGFRIGLKGAQGLYGIEPDLTCLGKVIGGGFPAAAFGGREEIMNHLAPLGPVYQAGTLSGNPVAMQAAYATFLEIEKEGFYEELERKTRLLTDPLQAYIQTHRLPLCLNRIGSCLSLFFGLTRVSSREDLGALDTEAFKQFFLYLFERGVYIPPSAYETWFVSEAHTEEHLIYARDLILAAIKEIYSNRLKD